MHDSAPPRRTDLAADHIREEILRGVYQAGDRLPGERDMAARLGVNRGAVREALKTLELQGLVATRPGGTTVCALHDASISVVRHLLRVDGVADCAVVAQLLDVHEMLVCGATRLAIERGSDDDMLHAQELATALGDPALQGPRLIERFDEIVELITRASGNLVLRLWRNTVRPALAEHLDPVRDHIRSEPRHAEIVARLSAALRARDADSAEVAVRRLLRHRRDQLIAALEASALEARPDPRAH
jgi:DNA-binding FadR family transcriptional regulator